MQLRAVILVCVAAMVAPSGQAQPRSHAADGQLTVTWDNPIEVASGNAFRGPWRMNDSQWDFVDDPTVAINDDGLIGVAWTDHPTQDILFQKFDSDGAALLDEPVNVSRSGRIFSWLPRMILTSADDPGETHVYILWQEIVFSGGSHGGEIFFACSSDGGRTFSAPLNLSNTTAGAGKGRLDRRSWHNGSLDLAFSQTGDLYAAWTEYEGNLWFSRSTNGGRTFFEPLHVAGGDDRPARGPTLAVEPGGAIYLAWTVGEDPSANIHFAWSTDGGRSFTTPRIVHQDDGHADAPKISIDRQGVIHLVYAHSAAGIGGRYRLLYTRAKVEEHDFSEPRQIVTPRAADADSVHFPMLRLDGADHLYLTWERFPDRRGRPFGLGFTTSFDGGETFTAPTIIPGSVDPAGGFNGSQQGLLMSKLAVNRVGAIAVVNSTWRAGQSSVIRLIPGQCRDD